MPRNTKTFTIEAIMAGMHSSYWLSACAFSGFMAVYLSYYGFTDGQIGITAALTSLFTIVYQLFISSYSDKHPQVPLKRLITLVYLLILALVAILALVPLPVALMLLVYALAGGFNNGMPGLYNASFLRLVDAGLPLNLGWPRGVSALVYALFAYLLGLLLENHSPSILMPITLVCLSFAILMVLLMPRPEQLTDNAAIPDLAEPVARVSLREVLSGNQVLLYFLLSAVFMSAGQANVMLFLTRVIQSKGGGEAALGLAMFLQAGVEMPAMFLSPRLLRRFRARAILSFSVFSYFIKALIILFSGGMVGIYIAMAFSVFCFGLYGISSMFYANSIARPGEKVRVQSLIGISGALSAIISNPLAGFVVQHYGIQALNILCAVFLAIASLLMFYSAGLHLQQEKSQRGNAPPAFPFLY